MASRIDMAGRRFGILTVTNLDGRNESGALVWLCICDCGETRRIAGTDLRAGRYKSCGCNSPKFKAEDSTVEGYVNTRIYSIWVGMKYRCSPSAKGKDRRNYFDKGIRVCERWMTFNNFLEDMGNPENGHSIERIDGNKGYFKENCIWADAGTQANNTSRNHFVEHNGKILTVSQWAKEIGINKSTLLGRLRRGLTPAEALRKEIVPKGTLLAQKKLIQRKRNCETCGTEFYPRERQILNGRGRFCSRGCIRNGRPS